MYKKVIYRAIPVKVFMHHSVCHVTIPLCNSITKSVTCPEGFLINALLNIPK